MRLIITAIFFLMAYSSIAQQSGQALKGKWQVDFNGTVSAMDTANYRKFTAIPSVRKAQVTESFATRIFEFGDSNAVRVSFKVQAVEKQVHGTWQYDPSTRRLAITATGTTKTYSIVWQNANKILLKYDNTNDQWLLKSLLLIKQN